MSTQPKVSLLVAVYNAAETLPRCLDSLLAQTLNDIQIICIDDASTDDSPALLAQYASRDKRVKVLRLSENSGQAHARNQGLALAEGAFIGMVDADDWLAPDALQQAWQVVSDYPDTDAVLFDLIKVWPDGKKERYEMDAFDGTPWSGFEAMRLSLRWHIHGLYLVRSDIHKAYPYDETARLYSDDNTTRLHYLHSREVRTCSGRYYYYQNPLSTTQRVSPLYFESLRAQHHMKKLLEEENIDKAVVDDYEQYRWMGVVDCCYYLACHREAFNQDQRHSAREAIHTAYNTFSPTFVSPHKFGYRRLRSFRLFFLQERVYFFLRRLARRL